jgi:uncharacterized LabA/DUF88 family protein
LPDTRLKIAVFIDFDNIEIGVKSTLGGQFDIGVVLEALKERGEVVSKIAYGDWTRAADFSRSLTQHATKLVQRNLTPGGDKNGADINLALDALEMAFTHSHINAYVIVGGDSDFITLVEKLKQYDKQVFVVGGRAFTSVVMQRNCHEFIAYENLVGARRASAERGRPSAAVAQAPIEQVVGLVRRALKVLSDREVSPQLGLLKSTLLQLDSTFSERTYGAGSFRDFAQKLAAAGHVTLRESGRTVLVELPDGDGVPASGEEPPRPAPPARHGPRPHARGEGANAGPEPAAAATAAPAASGPAPRVVEGIRAVRRLFQTAQNPPRWPMYIRQTRQFLRNVDPTFDERNYGFTSFVDLLRACQRERMFRIERDHQGVMRVFAGNVMQVPVDFEDDDDNRGNVAESPVARVVPEAEPEPEREASWAPTDGPVPAEIVGADVPEVEGDLGPEEGREDAQDDEALPAAVLRDVGEPGVVEAGVVDEPVANSPRKRRPSRNRTRSKAGTGTSRARRGSGTKAR